MWTPLLIIENARETRQAGAATESLRNEMFPNVDRGLDVLIARAPEPQKMIGP